MLFALGFTYSKWQKAEGIHIDGSSFQSLARVKSRLGDGYTSSFRDAIALLAADGAIAHAGN